MRAGPAAKFAIPRTHNIRGSKEHAIPVIVILHFLVHDAFGKISHRL
jgi:hypothetical protein